MHFNLETLDRIACECGESFYLLDSEAFMRNFIELQDAFRGLYPNTHLAYSYKTNYTPALCKIVDKLGGFAEVVSDMEYGVASRIGVSPHRIIFNGPYKNREAVTEILLSGGIVNLDSMFELPIIEDQSAEYPERELKVGIRCNFDIGDGVLSRFGMDVTSEDFNDVLNRLQSRPNINLVMLHCHFATRSLESWHGRIAGLWDLLARNPGFLPPMIDLGGGLFGKMPDSLKRQFSSPTPTYEEYADIVAGAFARRFTGMQPMLLVEPGSAVVGDVMHFVTKVVSMKTIRGKDIAILHGSVYNINPTLNGKNPPVQVVHTGQYPSRSVKNLDFGGFTCIESDYLYRGYTGEIAIGDYVVFGNVGSYSVVLKPPFILPNFPVIEYNPETDHVKMIKHAENFNDIFHTYVF